MKTGFTFKTTKPTGRYRSFSAPYHEIKLGGAVVGNIAECDFHTISLNVIKADINEDGNPNCPFKRIRLKAQHPTLDDAKKFLNDNFDKIIALNLYKNS